MRSYLILKDKAKRWNADKDINAILEEINASAGVQQKFSKPAAEALLGRNFDRAAIAKRGLKYERLDQLTMEVLFGTR